MPEIKWKYIYAFAIALTVFSRQECANNYKNVDNILPEVLGEPLQTEAADKVQVSRTVEGKDWVLTPVFDYKISALVFGVSHNALGMDRGVNSVDLGLLWGSVAQSKVYKKLKLRVMLNWWEGAWENDVAVDVSAIANNHCITFSPAVRDKLRSVITGDQVTITGRLVNAVIFPAGSRDSSRAGTWKSSITRKDTAGGACELVYIDKPEDIVILRRGMIVYEYLFKLGLFSLVLIPLYLFVRLNIRSLREAKNNP